MSEHNAESDACKCYTPQECERLGHSAENDAGCGGCRGIGSHRGNCPRHPDYHPWKRLAAMADSIGDSIGVPELANRAWGLAGAIREAMPDHPYRVTPPVSTEEGS